MGLFNNKSKIKEFDDSAKSLMDIFIAANSPEHPSFDVFNEISYLKKYSELCKKWRDLAGKEKLYGYASLFSTMHWRTYVKVNTNAISRNHSELFSRIDRLGFLELDFLYTDLHYLNLGVQQHGVAQIEYDECKSFVEMLKNLLSNLISDAASKSKEPGFLFMPGTSGLERVSAKKLINSLEPYLERKMILE